MKLLNNKIVIPVIILCLQAFIFEGFSQIHNDKFKAEKNLLKLAENFPQQKVYLHIDKDEYIAGENIWIKVYLVDAITHKPVSHSANLNIEMVNIKGAPVSFELLHVEQGFAHAGFPVPDSLAEGNYQVRAYTDWMLNFNSDLYFSKDIFIHNPVEENFIRFIDRLKNRRFNNRLENRSGRMQFAFFPEGGNLAEGLDNRVAFKAANSLGEGKDVTGVLFDDDDNMVLDFESVHNGMGVFSFTPGEGKKYYAEIKYPNGQEKTVDLPGILTEGYILSVDVIDDEIRVEVKQNFDPGLYDLNDDIHILAQVRGRPHFYKKGSINNNAFNISIPTGNIPHGICHITLFDSNITPVGERLVFHDNNSLEDITLVTKETRVGVDDYLSVELLFKDFDEAKNGSYSVSVTAPGNFNNTNPLNENIATYLLLSSDLDGIVEEPWFYLSSKSVNSETALDLIMMTHGWRRFDWNEVLDVELADPEYDVSPGITLRGRVSAASSSKQVGEQNVKLTVIKNGEPADIYNTTTGSNGHFEFDGLFYEGAFTAELALAGDRSRRTMNIDLETKDLYSKGFSKSFLTRPVTVLNRGDNWERVSRPKTLMQRRRKPRHVSEASGPYGNPDQVVYMEDLRAHYTQMMQILKTHVRGLREDAGGLTLRGPSSFSSSNEPLYMIDGVQTNKGNFMNLYPREVERIEVFVGPSTSMFGVRGGNGVLIAYTRTHSSGRQAYVEYLLNGYYSPREFFQSKINIDQYIETNVSKTISWKPMMKPDEKGKAEFRFPLDQNWDNYKIIIEGIDNKGNITFKEYVYQRSDE